MIKKEEMAIVQRNIAGALTNLTEKESFIVRHRRMADNPMTLQEENGISLPGSGHSR